jgi:DNA-binding protein HU-beta
MTKSDFIEAVQKACKEQDLSKKATGDIVDAVFNTMGKALQETGRCSYPNFGTFKVTERAARKGRNPRTGDEIEIEASKTVKFGPAPSLKSKL